MEIIILILFCIIQVVFVFFNFLAKIQPRFPAFFTRLLQNTKNRVAKPWAYLLSPLKTCQGKQARLEPGTVSYAAQTYFLSRLAQRVNSGQHGEGCIHTLYPRNSNLHPTLCHKLLKITGSRIVFNSFFLEQQNFNFQREKSRFLQEMLRAEVLGCYSESCTMSASVYRRCVACPHILNTARSTLARLQPRR